MADIEQAIIWLDEGKKIRRKEWAGQDIHIKSTANLIRYGDGSGFIADTYDLKAKDWELHQEDSAIQGRINLVYKSLKQIEALNGTFILKEAIKLFASRDNGE